MITNVLLKRMLPLSTETNRQKYLPFLNECMTEHGITTNDRIAMFMAQIGHESGQLRYSEEIASGAAYEGRADLGNAHAGDGKRFKGRGLIQITGRANYRELSTATGVDFLSNPELLSTPKWAVFSACWWWSKRGLNKVADTGDFKRATKIINGGYNGYNDRVKLWENIKKVLA